MRIAELDERSYREKLWSHTPLTDFWRVGRGYARSLERLGLYTMGDIARCSVGRADEYYNEEILYKLFGVGAELLIDHAWGYESCTMEDVKSYKPRSHSMSAGQVLHCAYTAENAKLVALEMADQLSLDLVRAGVVCDRITLSIGYDKDSPKGNGESVEMALDYYGRVVPKGTHGTYNFGKHTSLTSEIMAAASEIFDRIVNNTLLIRRINITAGNTISATAHLRLKKGKTVLEGVCIGDGPIDAAFLAIESITGQHYELDDFQIQAVTEGREAMGQTVVKLRSNGKL